MPKILFTGGGSGGHTVPVIAISRELKKIYKGENLSFFFIGPKDELDSSLLAREGIKTKTVLTGKIRRYVNFKTFWQNLFDVFIKMPIGFLQAFFYIFLLSPDLVFSKGGFGSIPAVLAGKFLLVPVFLHESDVTPGIANKLLRSLALEIFTSFPETESFSSKKLILVGNPVRKELLAGSREEAEKLLNLSSGKNLKPVILILGGSQGAQRINDKVMEVLPNLLKDFEIIHQCGKNNYRAIRAESEAIIVDKRLKPFYHLFGFLEEKELAQSYVAADLIVSRAGSGSIFEIAAAGKPCFLIPLPESAQNHQIKNAYNYHRAGACLVFEENNFTAHFFLEKMKFLFFDKPEKLKEMAQRAKEFSKPRAAWIIANYLSEYLTK